MDLLPFEFQLHPQETSNLVCSCGVYVAEIEVKLPEGRICLCRICLGRLRTTLKSALKALPKLPKISEHPKD